MIKRPQNETIIAFLYFFFSMYIMALFQVWADARNPGSDGILPDIGFETLPHYMNDFMVTDIYVYGWLLITLWRLYYTGNFEIALRRFFWISGTLYIIRGFTITFTVLPTPYTGCQPRIHEMPLVVAVKIVFGNLSTCGDVLYSGHTMMLTASALMWQLYDRRRFAVVIAWIISVVGMLIIISTHFHYSDDVIIAFIFTTFVHMVYFLALQLNYYEQYTPSLIQYRTSTDNHHHHCADFLIIRRLISIIDADNHPYYFSIDPPYVPLSPHEPSVPAIVECCHNKNFHECHTCISLIPQPQARIVRSSFSSDCLIK